MIQELCSFMFGGHKQCKSEIHRLLQTNIDETKKVKDLNDLVTQLMHQIQELKALHHFQTIKLETKIAQFEKEKNVAKPNIDKRNNRSHKSN